MLRNELSIVEGVPNFERGAEAMGRLASSTFFSSSRPFEQGRSEPGSGLPAPPLRRLDAGWNQRCVRTDHPSQIGMYRARRNPRNPN